LLVVVELEGLALGEAAAVDADAIGVGAGVRLAAAAVADARATPAFVADGVIDGDAVTVPVS
jgi:hypothetical protein